MYIDPSFYIKNRYMNTSYMYINEFLFYNKINITKKNIQLPQKMFSREKKI